MSTIAASCWTLLAPNLDFSKKKTRNCAPRAPVVAARTFPHKTTFLKKMNSIAQREELQAAIWRIANEVRGAVDGWDFKQFVLGTLFYRFISEHFTRYIEGGDESVHYAELPDSVITPEVKADATRTKGYFIYPSQLFVNVARTANSNESLNTDLASIFAAIEASAQGYESERDIKGLFDDFDTTSNRLGHTVADKNKRLAAVIKGVESLDFGHFEDNEIDLFGDAYEYLISNYAANAGKSGASFSHPKTCRNSSPSWRCTDRAA